MIRSSASTLILMPDCLYSRLHCWFMLTVKYIIIPKHIDVWTLQSDTFEARNLNSNAAERLLGTLYFHLNPSLGLTSVLIYVTHHAKTRLLPAMLIY